MRRWWAEPNCRTRPQGDGAPVFSSRPRFPRELVPPSRPPPPWNESAEQPALTRVGEDVRTAPPGGRRNGIQDLGTSPQQPYRLGPRLGLPSCSRNPPPPLDERVVLVVGSASRGILAMLQALFERACVSAGRRSPLESSAPGAATVPGPATGPCSTVFEKRTIPRGWSAPFIFPARAPTMLRCSAGRVRQSSIVAFRRRTQVGRALDAQRGLPPRGPAPPGVNAPRSGFVRRFD